MMVAGLNGGTRNGAAALATGHKLVGVCAQERATRVRGGGGSTSGWPVEALDLLLQRQGRSRADVQRYVLAENGRTATEDSNCERIAHHYAHACTAYLTSSFSSSAIVVCDHEAPRVSVWKGEGATVTAVEWPWEGSGFCEVFSHVARLLGFSSEAADQRLEALARLSPDSRDARFSTLLTLDDGAVRMSDALDAYVTESVAGHAKGSLRHAAVAAAVQARLGELLLGLLERVCARVGAGRLCLAGSLFYHSSMNTLVKRAAIVPEIFVPVDPGNSGLAVGAALQALGRLPSKVSPFLGPAYSAQETKEILDNCKLQYSWESEDGAVTAAIDALREGRLVGWFDGAMEWGPRALGARCILANPHAPYVLENLNRFLKHREPWRGYALSGPAEAVTEHFEGPATAPFMECDYRPRDPGRFRHALPSPSAAVRVHTVSPDGPPRFARLLEAFGEREGLPFLINTSFNGFHEPIVCSPRDAVRVFYGSGLDLLVMNQFLLRK